jgi:hypothetical protein
MFKIAHHPMRVFHNHRDIRRVDVFFNDAQSVLGCFVQAHNMFVVNHESISESKIKRIASAIKNIAPPMPTNAPPASINM